MKRIPGPALIELRREMYKEGGDKDALILVLMGEIDRLKYDKRYKQNSVRLNSLQESCANAWAKVDHLKAQMYKMTKGYEKKIARKDVDIAEMDKLLENTPIK